MGDVLTVLGVDGTGGEIRLAAVVDTGARMSVLPSDVLGTANIHERLDPVDVAGAFGVVGTRAVVVVTLRLLQHGGQPHALPVIVGEPGEPPLVGMDLLQCEGLVIDTETRTLRAKEEGAALILSGAEPLPSGGYVLNAPKGYARTIARLRFDATRPRGAGEEAQSALDRVPSVPSGYKVKR